MERDDELKRAEQLLWELHKLGGPKPSGMSAEEIVRKYREMIRDPAHASVAARQIIGELRHQYVLAFEASSRAGWRPLQVRARKDSLTVRARSGYSGGEPSSDFENAVSAAPSGPAIVR